MTSTKGAKNIKAKVKVVKEDDSLLFGTSLLRLSGFHICKMVEKKSALIALCAKRRVR